MQVLKSMFLGCALVLLQVGGVQAGELDAPVSTQLSSGLIVRESAVQAGNRTVYLAPVEQAVADEVSAREATEKFVNPSQLVSAKAVHELDQITSDEAWCYWPSYNYYSYYWYGYNYYYYPTYSWYYGGYYYYYYYYRY